jgi:crossover junction endodeoxyribonuclease RuvC
VSVLGIDPGTRRCGYAVVDRRGNRLVRVASGVLVVGDGPMPERLGTLLDALLRLADAARIDAVAVETAYCGRSARSALALGLSRGVALAAAARAGRPVFEYAPAEVKRAFTGSGRAEKAQMVSTARMLFGVAPRLADEADALAVAVCHLARCDVRPLAPARASTSAPTSAAVSRLRPSVRRFAGAP